MRRVVHAALALAAVTFPASSSHGASMTVVVSVQTKFTPASTSVVPGLNLTYLNADMSPHTLTSLACAGVAGDYPDVCPTGSERLFDSGRLGGGESAEVSLAKLAAGQTYPYVCTIHPFMTGTIEVIAT